MPFPGLKLRRRPHCFTFYLGNPFPLFRFRFDFVADLFRVCSHFLRSVRFHGRSFVNLIDSAQNSAKNRIELAESPHRCARLPRSQFPGSVRYSQMSKRSVISFTRRGPDNITEELIAVLSSKASFEFKPLFEIMLLNLRERNAASGGEEMLRLRAYEKLQGLVNQGAVNRTITGTTKKYKGVAARMAVLRTEMEALRAACNQRALAKGCRG
jgi:hypothetical protein